jgi:hypothetical protein
MIGWAIAVVGGAVGGLWVLFVTWEFRRLRRMQREVSERIAAEEKARK